MLVAISRPCIQAGVCLCLEVVIERLAEVGNRLGII